jgi:hypothetical protein
MRLTFIFVLLLLCISVQAELIFEKSLTLSGHHPEKWGLKHIKTELSNGYFKFNELIDIKTTTEKMSQKKYTRKLNLILNLENTLLKNSKPETLTCNRKLIVESKQKTKSLVTNSFCLDNLKAKDLALITKTIQQLKN